MTPQRFIPFRKAEIIDLLCARPGLAAPQVAQFRQFTTVLASLYHFEFQRKLERLKDSYFPFDPDHGVKTLRVFSADELVEHEKTLVATLAELLNDANYQPITSDELAHAMNAESLFHISLSVDFADFERYILFSRGSSVRTVELRDWLWRKKSVAVPTFDRVALLIKFKSASYYQQSREKSREERSFTPGAMTIKLFANIPRADLEMLFPNTRIGMTTKDKLILAVPGAVVGVGVFAKTGAALFAATAVVALMVKSLLAGQTPTYPGHKETAVVTGAVFALGTIIGYVFKQWSAYKARKFTFMKTLTDNLYFRNLDNNAGVFHHLVDSAEEEECKEALLAYHFLLTAEAPLDAETLDQRIESWFTSVCQTELDFEVSDALRKLTELDLCTFVAGKYAAVDLGEACRRLDARWDNYFQFN